MPRIRGPKNVPDILTTEIQRAQSFKGASLRGGFIAVAVYLNYPQITQMKADYFLVSFRKTR